MRVIGRRGGETYPERPGGGGGSGGAFAFEQNSTAYSFGVGTVAQIASATINVSAGSRIKIEGLACFLGSVAAGEASLDTPSVSSVIATQSFDSSDGTNRRTCNYLGVTGIQPGGPVTVILNITVAGSAGAHIDSQGDTMLTLTEVI
jgi:hypothetical protein